ncbi:Gfo/Idh/MocA family protein [Halobacillus salinus]|uniref:Gfo/Idh/MocA family oxidoreductase n=1 Tax=Halobacillus salinus TaxID=192814 RepID=A0A4Z0GVA4_9BACI|nr:Gfo/Idh/MocA family oxidoreductase [Halobacillus salinus]TGB01138.1 Gfo/Idh/MocA family oxidoreductase [Halobacillus salinus]
MIKVGIIGCGYISRKHIDTICQLETVDLLAVSDVQPKRMEEIIDCYRDKIKRTCTVKKYPDYRDLILDSEVDMIIISVISGLHADIAKEALIEGKHIIIEKPLALSIREADEIIQLSETSKSKVLVCHQLRYRPLISKIKEILDSGDLGVPLMGSVSARINRSADYYNAARWRGSWKEDGGMLVNQGIHIIDILVWLLGDIETVYGEISKRQSSVEKETEDIAAGIIHFSNQAKGVIDVNTITQPRNQGYSISLFCEKGSIIIGGSSLERLEHCYIEDNEDLVNDLYDLCDTRDEHLRMYQNFTDAILKDTPLIMDAVEGKKALETIFSLYESSVRKRPIHLPLLNFSTTDMLQFPINEEIRHDT